MVIQGRTKMHFFVQKSGISGEAEEEKSDGGGRRREKAGGEHCERKEKTPLLFLSHLSLSIEMCRIGTQI